MKSLQPDEIIAKYKIQVMYGEGRTTQGPNNAVVTLWESGKHLDGGGDEKIYIHDPADHNLVTGMGMPAKAVKREAACGMPIPSSSITGSEGFCPHCGELVRPAMMTGEVFYRLPTGVLAQRLVTWWERLSGDADLYIKYHQDDIRYLEMMGRLGPERTDWLRGLLVYPLANILKDTAAGKELSRTFVDCLSA